MNNPLDAQFLMFALELLLKSSVILLAAFGVNRLLRRANAQLRQWVWKATISSLLLLPLSCVLMPTWRIPIQFQVETAPVLAPPTESIVQFSAPKTSAPAPETVVSAPETVPSAPVIAEISTPNITPPPPHSGVVLPSAEPDVPQPTYPILLGITLCSFGLVLLRSLVAFTRLRFLARRATVCIESHIVDSGQKAAHKLGLTRPVQLLIAAPNSRERVPMTWGYRRPCVLLPSDAQGWEESRTHAVLLHEFAHVARADWLMQQIASLTCALYCFHPLVWKAARSLKLESERACDECVIAAGICPTDYATVLLETARAHKQRVFSPEGAISMANPAHLSVRIQSILDSRISRKTPSRPLIFCCSILSLAGIMALSALRPADAAEPLVSVPVVAQEEAQEAPLPTTEPTNVKPLKYPSDAFAKQIDPRVATLMKQVEAKAKSVRSVSADVEITLTVKGQNEQSRNMILLSNGKMQMQGKLRLMKPNLYRLRYQEVQDNFIASDGTTEWIAMTDTVYGQQPVRKGDSGHLPFPLSNFIVPCVDYAPYTGGLGDTKATYKGKKTEQGKVYDIVEIRRSSPAMKYLYRLYIGADKLIHRATFIEKQGRYSQRDIRLSNIRVNPALSPAEFAFTPEETARYSKPRRSVPKPKLTSFLPAPTEPDAKFTGKIAWGEVKDGLQTGSRLPANKSVYTKTDTLTLQYVLRNVGKNTRRLKLLVPASVYLNSVSQMIFRESESVEGDLRWRGREEGLSRIELILPPGRIVPLSLDMEPVRLSRYGESSLRPGIFMTRWDVPIEYRDAESPEMSRLKMPRPGSVSVMIVAASPKPVVSERAGTVKPETSSFQQSN